MIGWVPVCRLPEVVDDKLLSVQVCGDNVMVTRATDGTLRVANAHCPHLGTHLGKSSTFCKGVVSCPLHLYELRLDDGACIVGQKSLRLTFYKTRVAHGLVFIEKEAEDFVEAAPGEAARAEASPIAGETNGGSGSLTHAFEIEDAALAKLLPRFSRGGELEEGLVVASPPSPFSQLRIFLVPVAGTQLRVFVVAALAGVAALTRRLDLVERTGPGRLAYRLSLGALLERPALRALRQALERGGQPDPEEVQRSLRPAGELRYQPKRPFINDWMFVGFVRELRDEPMVVERMGRHVRIARQPGGAIEVTSADGTYRYASKVDPSYGAILAYFNYDWAPPPWTIPDFEFTPEDRIFDSYHTTAVCNVEDVHGTVLDWTHLTGYHKYAKSHLLSKRVTDYSIHSTYVTAGKEFAKFIRLGDVENINRVTIHGLCNLDFSFTGYFDEKTSFDLRLLSMIYLSGGQTHQMLICSYKKDLNNAPPVWGPLMYLPFKRFSFEVAKWDLITETRSIYNYKRLLREPQVASQFPYASLYEYAKKFYPAEPDERAHPVPPPSRPADAGAPARL